MRKISLPVVSSQKTRSYFPTWILSGKWINCVPLLQGLKFYDIVPRKRLPHSQTMSRVLPKRSQNTEKRNF